MKIKNLLTKQKEYKTYDIICPYCFRRFLPSEVVFRAMHSVEHDDEYKLQQDALLNRHRSKLKLKPLSELEAVIDPKSIYKENRLMIKGVLIQVIDKYGIPTRKRLCPYCHNDLPVSLGKGPAHIISIIGSPKTGKSTYMSVLLHILQNTTAQAMDSAFYFAGSRYRYLLKEQEHQLFTEGRSLSSDLGEDCRDHLVLIYNEKGSIVPITFIFYDAASEAMLNQKLLETYEANIKNSSGIIFLVDPLQLKELREKTLKEDRSEKIYRARDVVAQLFQNFIGNEGKCSIPTAVVVTKTDKLKNNYIDEKSKLFEDYKYGSDISIGDMRLVHNEVTSFIEKTDKEFLDALKRYFKYFACFGVSALISSEEEEKQGRIKVQPKRIEEPLLWIMYKLGYIKGGKGR